MFLMASHTSVLEIAQWCNVTIPKCVMTLRAIIIEIKPC